MSWLVPRPAPLNETVSEPLLFRFPLALMKCSFWAVAAGTASAAVPSRLARTRPPSKSAGSSIQTPKKSFVFRRLDVMGGVTFHALRAPLSVRAKLRCEQCGKVADTAEQARIGINRAGSPRATERAKAPLGWRRTERRV